MTYLSGIVQSDQITDEPSNITSIEHLLAKYKRYLYLEETEDIEITLAALLDREIPGDPVWLQYIAPSGDKKTEVVRSYSLYDKAYTLDTFTPKTLLSGLTQKNKETGETEPAAGLISKINGKCLIIKDFTTILGKSVETRTEIYSQLRSIYDGYYEGGYGTLKDKIREESKIGVIACATPAIDKYNKLENDLGTRFLKIRSNSDPIKAATMALRNAGNSDYMRKDLQHSVKSFIDSLYEQNAFDLDNLPTITQDQKNQIIMMAQYVATMRATVWGKYDSKGDLILLEAVNQEKPTRVAKQFMKTGKLLAIIKRHNEIGRSDIASLRRIAKDTADPNRQAIIDVFQKHGDFRGRLTPQDIEGISRNIGRRVHYKTARNELEIMETLEILDRNNNEEYSINPSFIGILRSIYPLSTSEKKPNLGLFFEENVG